MPIRGTIRGRRTRDDQDPLRVVTGVQRERSTQPATNEPSADLWTLGGNCRHRYDVHHDRDEHLSRAAARYTSHVKRDWNSLGWCAVLLAWAVLILHQQVGEQLREASAATATAVGRVTANSPGFRSRDDGEPATVKYSFITDDGAVVNGSDEAWIPVGESVTVRYDPQDPRVSFLGESSQSWFERLAVPLLLFYAGVYGLAVKLRSRVVDRHGYAEVNDGSRTSSPARFFVLLLVGVSAYFFLCDAGIVGHAAHYRTAVSWLCGLTFAFISIVAYRWQIRWAAALTAAFALLVTPLLQQMDRWPILVFVGIGVHAAAVRYVHPPSETEDNGDVAIE